MMILVLLGGKRKRKCGKGRREVGREGKLLEKRL